MNPRLSLDLLGVVLIKVRVATMMHCRQTSGGSAGEARIGVGVRSETLSVCLACAVREKRSVARVEWGAEPAET